MIKKPFAEMLWWWFTVYNLLLKCKYTLLMQHLKSWEELGYMYKAAHEQDASYIIDYSHSDLQWGK